MADRIPSSKIPKDHLNEWGYPLRSQGYRFAGHSIFRGKKQTLYIRILPDITEEE